MNSRRDFLKGTAWMGATAFVAGCHLNRFGFGDGGTMSGFALPKMKNVRVGFAGVGGRGTAAVHRVAMLPGVTVAALCDKKDVRVDENVAWLRANHFGSPNEYHGDDTWRLMCQDDAIDVIYIATPWALHAPIALEAMRNGKVALVEVPSALTIDECWELVETSEETKMPCMILENCCYGEMEMLGLNLVRSGVLGEIVHGEGGYIHDLRWMCDSTKEGEGEWRYGENLLHKGNRYATHGLVPIMQAMNINRGDRFDYLVSLESNQANFTAFKHACLAKDDPRLRDPAIEMGDMNMTLIKTYRGRSILVEHDVSSPRPYSRINLLSGTNGLFWGIPWRGHWKQKLPDVFRIALEQKRGEGAHSFLPDEEAEKIRQQYKHPLWKQVGEIAKKVGGHGGMDFIMDLRWAYCLQNGLPLDMDVYDLATASSLCELTEKSVRNRSQSVDVPDFTRGKWRTAKPLEIVTCDMAKLNFTKTRRDEATRKTDI